MSDERSEDEIKAVHLHRYKMWVEAVDSSVSQMQVLQQQMAKLMESANGAFLEAREEMQALKELGMSREEIESVARVTVPTTDPLSILKQVQTKVEGT